MARIFQGLIFAAILTVAPISSLVEPSNSLPGAAFAAAHTGGNGSTGTTRGSVGGNNDRGQDSGNQPGRPRTSTPRNTGVTVIEVIPTAPVVVRPPAPPRTRVRPRTPVRAVALPDRAPLEIVTLDLSAEDLALLLTQGFTLIDETVLEILGLTSRRLRVPRNVSDADALEIVRGLPSGGNADFNHFYRAGEGPTTLCQGVECAARVMVGWTVSPEQGAVCGQGVTVGMIDSAINLKHETFADVGLELHRLTSEKLRPSRAVHGTAVAALLVGNPASRSPGLVPGAKLVAVDAFFRAGNDERADVYGLAQGLEMLAQGGVRVINLSLAGADNRVLKRLVDKLTGELDVVIVAAVGNAGPTADPQFPAGYDTVLAVTAVDRRLGLYAEAVRGAHVDVAAPGVEVWTAASLKGAKWRTGTSFAAPFVTAAAAMLRQAQPELTTAQIAEALRGTADDLGDPGADALFGAGLLRIGEFCKVTP